MSSLYVDRRDVDLELDGGALVLREAGERIGTIPLVAVERVFLRSFKRVDSRVLGQFGEHNANVVVLSGRKAQPVLFLTSPHNDVSRRLALYKASQLPEFCLRFSVNIVRKKIHAQSAFLQDAAEKQSPPDRSLLSAASQLKAIEEKVSMQTDKASLRGLEGAAAQIYFGALINIIPTSLGFQGRNKRPPKDPFNAILSLGYTLLTSEASIILHSLGLDPYIGLYHEMDFGRASLSCDIVEPLRAHYDRFALALFQNRILRSENFSTTTQGCFLGKAGRCAFYPAYEQAAESFRKELTAAGKSLIAELTQSTLCMSKPTPDTL